MATPASIDTIPTCQLQEDHVSMGATSAYKLQTIRENANYIFAIELLHATQAIEFNKGLKLSKIGQNIFNAFREKVDFLDVDRVISDDINKSLTFYKAERRHWVKDFDVR
jgi:histidine ammonia-lyase